MRTKRRRIVVRVLSFLGVSFFLLMGCVGSESVLSSSALGLDSLTGFRWENRLIVVFAEEGTNSAEIQLQLTKENSAILDRHILWFIITKDSITTNHTGVLSPTLTEHLRNNYAKLDTPIETILIGKDGNVKSRNPFFDSDAIYGQIDQMPMRQAEMKQQAP